MHRKFIYTLLFTITFCLFINKVEGQSNKLLDTAKQQNIIISQNKFINNLFQQAYNSVKKNPEIKPDFSVISGKSEKPYIPYQGKIIRHIFIEVLNFDRSFSDTSKRDNSIEGKLGKLFHTKSHPFVIKDNLFFKENTPVNAFILADNERFMRTVEYIADSRILIHTIKNNPDSVDIYVYTKDLFSIAGGLGSNGLNHINTNIFETNLAGMGQRVELSSLYDYNRTPEMGKGILYRKDNLFHTFIDATIGYSSMLGNGLTGKEETTSYFTLIRNLVSPYFKLAGGLTISHNQAYNLYHAAPDSNFLAYQYNLFDAWMGYNIAIKKLTSSINGIRDRRFIALRYFNRDYLNVPHQIKSFNPIYNSTSLLLAQITFFSQNYYKAQYVYGFGTTEDLPYGYNIAVTTGLQRQLNLVRPYAGTSISDYITSKEGDFIQYYLRAGGFLNNNKLQDNSFLFGFTGISRLLFINSTKIRQYLTINYTQLSNRLIYAPLRIDNYYGIRGFLSDSVYGARRISVQSETAFYLNFKFHGFRFAPFAYGDVAIVTPEFQQFSDSKIYASLGGGLRARNENLVFETIELRAYFFPVAPNNMKGFKLILNTNIRYRFSSNFITPPDIIQLNSQ